jgi:hypothetical protein
VAGLAEGVAARLEAKAASYIKEHRLPGAMVGIVDDGALVWSAAIGFSDVASRRAPDRQTLYRVASITKTVTGTAIMRLRDEGKLRLELYRAKQSVDRFAQRFGYAAFRAKKGGAELPAEELAAHMNNLTAAEAEVSRLETLIAEASKERKDWLLDNRPKPAEPETPPPAPGSP